MSLATQLQELRVRAGDPTIRQIERLIARQGRERPMARSTIQDKLSGKSPVNLPDVLSIVEALAEHARLNGAPLPQQEIDQGVWRERVTTFTKSRQKSPVPPGTPDTPLDQEIPWDIEALKLAEMYDLIEIVQNSSNLPTASWLPSVVASMLLAKMSVSEFMKRAAEDPPQAIVQTLVALNREFPIREPDPGEVPWITTDNDRTVGALLSYTARRHGARATPAIVVAMRRAGIGERVGSYLATLARTHPSRNIQHIVMQLRAATLSDDAEKVLASTGSHRQLERVFEVVLHFHTSGQTDDAKKILRGVATDGPFRIKCMAQEIGDHESANEFVREILRGIPYDKHIEYAERIRKLGSDELAQLVLEIANEPPF